MHDDIRFQTAAIDALQEATESYLVTTFTGMYYLTSINFILIN